MRRTLAPAVTALVLLISHAVPAAAALEVTLSVSPAEARVGQSVEVLVRTYLPIGQADVGLPVPSFAYPVSSGLWNILYPADYTFDILATAASGATIVVPIDRDPTDSTLWRGAFQPSTSGTWKVEARNFGADHPGASAVLRVVDDPAAPVAGAALVLGAAIVFLAGIVVGRWRSRT